MKDYKSGLLENLKNKKDSIWGVDLAVMVLWSRFNKGIRFLLCVIDICGKYACVVLLNSKMVLQLLMLFKSFEWVCMRTK